MDDSTKQRAMIGLVAGNFTVMVLMVGIGVFMPRWTFMPSMAVSVLIGGAVGAVGFFLAKAE